MITKYFRYTFQLRTKALLPHCAISAIIANPALSLAKHYHTLAPLPKGAGLRQGSIVSNISIFSDTRNVQITQNLSAVKAEGSPPRLSSLPQTPPTPHYPPPRTTQNPNLPPAAVTTIIHHSLFIKQKVRAFSDNGPRYKISM